MQKHCRNRFLRKHRKKPFPNFSAMLPNSRHHSWLLLNRKVDLEVGFLNSIWQQWRRKTTKTARWRNGFGIVSNFMTWRLARKFSGLFVLFRLRREIVHRKACYTRLDSTSITSLIWPLFSLSSDSVSQLTCRDFYNPLCQCLFKAQNSRENGFERGSAAECVTAVNEVLITALSH